MMDWLTQNAGMVGLVLFFALFLCFGVWAYSPGNRKKMEQYGKIPLEESRHGE
ncbi:MAG: cbb3-type cytochrome c oxidase subunit 3 [Alphaproteobacteria bacterium]|nr:cbb3-type cytochrome c oxidase subunit 3 [Alphaproteobacteria bacterium]MBV8549548.1 cbb3-type cytochrome c oxidase subunit 3 [Alphaproteobacteria bacterium]